MLTEAIGGVLPVAAAVALSPIPIVAVVLVLQGPGARARGLAFAAGWIVGLVAVATVVVVLASGASEPDSATATGVSWGLAGLGVACLVGAGRQWRKRPKRGEPAEQPAWVATVDSFSAAKLGGLGLVLSGANPKNLALTMTAAASIAEAGLGAADTAIAVAVFVAVGSLTVVGSVAFYVVAPSRAAGPLASVKQFMADNNATIMMVVLLLLGLKILGDAVPGLTG